MNEMLTIGWVSRGTQVATRMGNAKTEINSLNEKGLYDYLVINDSVDEVR